MIPDVQSHFETPKKIGLSPQKSYDFLITLVAIMFLSGGYAIWFISNYLYAYDDTEYAYTPRVHRATAAEVATSTDMTGWQTYRNEELGYEIMYPKNWEKGVPQGLYSEVSFYPPNPEPFTSYVSILIDSRKLEQIRSVLKLPLSPNNPIPANQETLTLFAGETAYEYRPNSTDKEHSDSVLTIIVPRAGKIYQISTGKHKLPEVKNILSTFKFLP